jgi:hypothetical protein
MMQEKKELFFLDEPVEGSTNCLYQNINSFSEYEQTNEIEIFQISKLERKTLLFPDDLSILSNGVLKIQ